MMNDRTRGIIHTIKYTTKSVEFALRDYLVDYYENAAPEDFPFSNLLSILRYTIYDYLSNLNNSSSELYRYCCSPNAMQFKDEWEMMVYFIKNIPVKEKDFHD